MENTLPFHTPDRVLDAPLLTFDLTDVVNLLKQEDVWKMGERNSITLMKSTYMRVVLIALHEQTEMNFHQSGNMMSVQIIEGSVTIQTDKKTEQLKKGCLLTLHEETKHTLIAMEASVFLLTIAICPTG
jgi:quercetin dioxygenase-like cupin family protein